jgi:hypothetical protein
MKTVFLLIGALLLSVVAGVASDSPEKPATEIIISTAPPAPPALPEGTMWRTIVGEKFVKETRFTIDVIASEGFSVDNTSDSSQQGAGGGANDPNGAPGDTGSNFNYAYVIIHRDMKTNLLPRITPLPGPTPVKADWDIEADVAYGRDCQGARMAGWDTHWGVNEPGATSPALAAANRQNFVCTPNMYGQIYLPFFKGIAITGGRYGSGLGWEIPLDLSNGPNYFYSHTYDMYSSSLQVLGVLASANLMRSQKHGYLLAELGLNNGEQTSVSPSGNTMGSFDGAIRWASPRMSSSLAYAFRIGNANIKTNAQGAPINTTDFGPLYTVLSPKGQLRQRHSIVATRQFNSHWNAEAEAVYFRQDGDNQASTIWAFGGPHYGGSRAAGVNGRAIYAVNPRLSTGIRLETFHTPDGFFLLPLNLHYVNGVPTLSKGYFNDVTLGANYWPIKNMRFRPEVRYDWNNNSAFGTGNASVLAGLRNPQKSQITWNMDMLFYF